MKFPAFLILFSLFSFAFLDNTKAEGLKLNYDCSFDVPMTSVYPPELYDPQSDGIFHISEQLRTKNIKGQKQFAIVYQKHWPVLINNSSIYTTQLSRKHLELRKKNGNTTYSIQNLELTGPLKRRVPARFKVYNSELYIGGACASCNHFVRGICKKK